MLDETKTKLAATVRALLLKALVYSFGNARRCAHDDVAGYTIVRGNLIHCKCGQAFKVKCMHTKVQQLMRGFWQCADCGLNRTR